MKKLLFIITFIPFLSLCDQAPTESKIATQVAQDRTRYVTFENNLADISTIDHENCNGWESATVYLNNVIFNPGEEKTVLLRKDNVCLRVEAPLNKWDDLGKLFGGKAESVFKRVPFLQSLINKLPDHYTLSCHINYRFEEDAIDITFFEFSELVCHLIDLLKQEKVDVQVWPHMNPKPGLRINLTYKDTPSAQVS